MTLPHEALLLFIRGSSQVARLLRLIKNAQGISLGGEMNAHVREAHRLISSIVTTVFLLVVMNTGLIQYVSSFTEVGGFYVSLEGTVRARPPPDTLPIISCRVP